MKIFKISILPPLLNLFIFFALVSLLYFFVHTLNLLPTREKIIPQFIAADILVGLTIYLKTSVDFALFIGTLMRTHSGWKKQIAIEIGTSLGNGIGTFFVLFLWIFSKQIPILMIIMIFLASIVLLRMAENSLKELRIMNYELRTVVSKFLFILHIINDFPAPVINIILPRPNTKKADMHSFSKLFLFSCSIPFVLGLDDFAGYIPLFSLVNVVSFATGVFLGHMLLLTGLFSFPRATTRIVSLPLVIFLGSMVFIGISLFGLYEIVRIFPSVLPR